MTADHSSHPHSEPQAHDHHALNGGFDHIDPDLVLQKLRSGQDLLLVDVRSSTEFRGGHIPSSRSMPIHQLVARSAEIASHKSDLIVLVSRTGARAHVAASALRLAGFTEVAILLHGLDHWRERGLPIQDTSTPPPPSVRLEATATQPPPFQPPPASPPSSASSVSDSSSPPLSVRLSVPPRSDW